MIHAYLIFIFVFHIIAVLLITQKFKSIKRRKSNNEKKCYAFYRGDYICSYNCIKRNNCLKETYNRIQNRE